MKSNFLYLISRENFNYLYKYGYFKANGDLVISFDCPVEELPHRDDIAKQFFAYVNPFSQYDSQLILHYSKNLEEVKGHFDVIKIEDVEHLYPLNNDAKRSMEEDAFDFRIRLEVPIWEEYSLAFKVKMKEKDIQLGIRNTMEIFNLKDALVECSSIISQNVLAEYARELCSGERPFGDQSLWIYLLQYSRRDPFPKKTRGYFMDTITVICSYLQKMQLLAYDSDVQNTKPFRLLGEISDDDKFQVIFDKIQSSKECSPFLTKVKELSPNVDFLKVATIFLAYREHFSKGLSLADETDQSYINKGLQNYGEELKYAVYLLGCYLGHEKTYSCYYEFLPLKLYKSKEEIANHRYMEKRKRDEAMAIIEQRQKDRENKGEVSIPRSQSMGNNRKNVKSKNGKGSVSNSKKQQPAYTPFPTFNGRSLRPISDDQEIITDPETGKKYVIRKNGSPSNNNGTDGADMKPALESKKKMKPALKTKKDNKVDLDVDKNVETTNKSQASHPNIETVLDKFPLRMSKEKTAKGKPSKKNSVIANNEEEFNRYKFEGYKYYETV